LVFIGNDPGEGIIREGKGKLLYFLTFQERTRQTAAPWFGSVKQKPPPIQTSVFRPTQVKKNAKTSEKGAISMEPEKREIELIPEGRDPTGGGGSS